MYFKFKYVPTGAKNIQIILSLGKAIDIKRKRTVSILMSMTTYNTTHGSTDQGINLLQGYTVATASYPSPAIPEHMQR